MRLDELNNSILAAEQAADQKRIRGPARTPFLLEQVSRLTGGRSLVANLALLTENARLAGRLAVALSSPDGTLDTR